jgi:glycosyltransferase involved in cell wall biosynthesis
LDGRTEAGEVGTTPQMKGDVQSMPPFPQSGSTAGGRRFSVIVPVYQHWALVSGLLACLQRQTLPQAAFETILVDNGSADLVVPEDLPVNVQVARCLEPGSYAARNHGAGMASGEWLAFTDADCLPAPEWLQSLDDAIERWKDRPALLAGSVEVVAASGKPGYGEIYDMVRGIPQSRYVSRGYGATANLAVPKALFVELGGFDAQRFSGGDAEFCRRAGAAGHAIHYVPRARVDHPARVSWQEIETKARRVKGGQVAAGRPWRRRIWMLATLVPPVAHAWRLLAASQHPLSHRLKAILVLHRVWVVELHELIRLLRGGGAERR